MSWRVKSTLFIILFTVSVRAVAIVPFSGELPIHWSTSYKHIIETRNTEPQEALNSARKLATLGLNQRSELKNWSALVYTELLIDNDSTAQAEKILGDTVRFNWRSLEGDMAAWHSLQIGLLLQYKGNYKRAYTRFDTAEAKHVALKVDVIQALAENYRYSGRLASSLNLWLVSHALAESEGDSTEIVESLVGIAVIRYLQNELEKSESELAYAMAFYASKKMLGQLAYVYSIKGLVRFQLEDVEGSIEYGTRSYDIRKQIGDVQGQGESLNNLALANMSMGNWNQALKYLNEAILLKSASEDFTQTAVILNNIGYCQVKLGNIEAAKQNYKLALGTATENGQRLERLTSLRRLSSILAKTGDHKAAYEYQRQYILLSDSIHEDEQAILVQDLEYQYETKKREQEILLLQKEQEVITNRWLNLASGLSLVIIIGVLIIDTQRRRFRQEKVRQNAEVNQRKSELAAVKSLLQENQHKLDEYTLSLLRKSEEVAKLEERLTVVGVKSADDEPSVEDFSTVRILTEEDWDEFKTLFDQVHEGLRNRLIRSFPSLTAGEQRLFLLLKLKLSGRQVAKILGVSIDSIKKARYRLKKKLELDHLVDLQEFVNGF